jgi:hypothetical protein
MNSPVRCVPVIQIRPNAIVEYLEWLTIPKRAYTPAELQVLEKRLESVYTGTVTDYAAKRIKKAVNLLVMSSPERWIYNPVTQRNQLFKLGFITLTVAEKECMLTARQAYDRLLKHFIQWLHRTKKVKSYIWKAELQRRGQIHYHITLNVFIPHGEIREKWNELQRREGLLENYYKKHGHYNPNSIDVHSVKKIKNLAGYFVKYLCKKDSENRKTEGKIWDCSRNLKEGKYYSTVLTNEHEWTLQQAASLGVITTIRGATR